MAEAESSTEQASEGEFVLRNPRVRRAVARAVVAASKKSGHPVPEWIRELAESAD